MTAEIERKFLVADESWRSSVIGTRDIRQGYLFRSGNLEARIRLADGFAYMTIKGGAGLVRREFEWEIPRNDGERLLSELCEPYPIQKTRHIVSSSGATWEIDVFHELNAGLVLAEIELTAPDQAFDRPSWLGTEVTDDKRYSNAELSRKPISYWPGA